MTFFKDEHDFQHELTAQLNKWKIFARVMVASTRMAGMPDLWIGNNNQQGWHVECKAYRLKRLPSIDDFMNLLDGAQRRVIPMEFWARLIYCPMYVWDVNKNQCYLYNGVPYTEYLTLTFEQLVEVIKNKI